MTSPSAIPTVDLSPFTGDEKDGRPFTDTDRENAGKALVAACHSLGFVNITGHGLTKPEISQAFGWVRRLFDLPLSDKMKAPHPPTAMPHRGYSGLGQEKVYSKADVAHGETGEDLRKVLDFKARPLNLICECLVATPFHTYVR